MLEKRSGSVTSQAAFFSLTERRVLELWGEAGGLLFYANREDPMELVWMVNQTVS
jgi:hypothetical protein